VVHDHSLAFQQDADPAPPGDCKQSPVSQWIAKPTAHSSNRLHLFADFRIVGRTVTPNSFGVDAR